MQIGEQFTEQGFLHPVVILTGIIDEYAEAGKTNEALYVFRMMMLESEDRAPNAYTFSVIINALAADKDPNFHGIAKELVMEMMGKGMQPNASTYIAVFEAFAGQGKMEEAKQFVEEMKGNGFVADKKAMRAMRGALRGKRPLVKIIIHILFDDSEDYSGDSEEDDDDIKKSDNLMERFNIPPNGYLGNKHVIEGDPENSKDLEYAFDMMCRMEPIVHTITRMVNMLNKDGFRSQALEIRSKFDFGGDIPEVVTHTGVMEIYAKSDQAKEAHKVFRRMLSLGVVPNAYTYSVIIKALAKDSDLSQALEIRSKFDFGGDIPEVVTHTGVMEIYAKSDQAKEAHKVFRRMLSLGVVPNAYTYSVIIKALAKDSDFLEDAKTYLLEMMDKGMQPNARTYTPVFKAFARLEEDNVKKGKEFLMEMKAKGFRAKKKDVMEVLKGRKGHVVQTVISILFGK